MSITMPAVADGYFDNGRSLTRGHRYFSNAILEAILQAARVDLSSQDARITVVEGLVAGMDQKASVDLCTAGALGAYVAAGAGAGKTITQLAAAVENIDGVAPVVGDRVLVNDVGTATTTDRGIYVVTTVGTVAVKQVLTRATDADGNSELTASMFVWVERGTDNGDTAWVLTTNDTIVVDTTALSFSEFTLSAHALSHILGGDLEVDGDRIGIDWNPSHSTPDATPPEAGNADHLTAILAGMDNTIGDHESRVVAIEGVMGDHKKSVRLATAGALGAYTQAGAGVGATLTQNAGAVENIDGVAVVAGDRILIKDGAAGDDNGIYVVTVVGDATPTQQVLTRATDADGNSEITPQMQVRVEEGTVNGGAEFVLANTGAIVVDTTALTFTLDNTLTHAADHERAGLLEIDGDHLGITWNPLHSTPDATPAEAGNVDVLAAHLAGVDNRFGADAHKQPVRLATAAALNAYTAAAGPGHGRTLTQNAPAIENIDGVAVVLGNRILVNDLGTATAEDRGIYTVTTVGTGAINQVLTRAEDFDESADIIGGAQVPVQEGTANLDTVYFLTTNDPITAGVTGLSFERRGRYAPVGDITTIDAGDVDAAGTADTYARGDHEHGVSTGVPVSVTGANAEGAATTLARSNHTHKLAALVQFPAHLGIAVAAGNAAAANNVNGHRTFDFNGGGVLDEQIAFEGFVPCHYSGGDLTVSLYWASAGAIIGDVKWDVNFERIQLDTLQITGDSFAAELTLTDTAPAAIGQVTRLDFTFTQAEADGITAGDPFRIRIQREESDAADTMVGDAQLLGVVISQ